MACVRDFGRSGWTNYYIIFVLGDPPYNKYIGVLNIVFIRKHLYFNTGIALSADHETYVYW